MTDRELLELLLEKVNSIESEVKLVKTQLNQTNENLTNFQNETTHNFAEMKNDLRIIIEQTAKNTELSSPIKDLQEQIKNHDTDIKLIKQILVN